MKLITVATLALLAATPALAQQGVSATEIVVGTAQDLSGPIVSLSKPAVNGMRMKIDEINAAGGVNGRKLRLVVEDHGYDPKRAVLAAHGFATAGIARSCSGTTCRSAESTSRTRLRGW